MKMKIYKVIVDDCEGECTLDYFTSRDEAEQASFAYKSLTHPRVPWVVEVETIDGKTALTIATLVKNIGRMEETYPDLNIKNIESAPLAIWYKLALMYAKLQRINRGNMPRDFFQYIKRFEYPSNLCTNLRKAEKNLGKITLATKIETIMGTMPPLMAQVFEDTLIKFSNEKINNLYTNIMEKNK